MVLVIEVGDYEIGYAIAINIAGIYSHASLGLTIGRVCDFSIKGGVFKRAVPLVDEQEVGRSVARDEEVGPAVIIYINSDDP
jgi:hypothetical protein